MGAVAEGVAVTVTVGFVVSVIYDWGFVYALGLDFSYLPTTTADHFRSGLLWFPSLLTFLLVCVAIEFQFQRVERGLTEKELVESSSNPKWVRKFRKGPWRFAVWIAPFYVTSFVLIGDAFATVLPSMLAVVWWGFADWCYSAPLIKLRRNTEVQFGFKYLPIVGIIAFFSGYNAAIDAAVRKPTQVTIERRESAASTSGNVLRALDKGLLVLGDGNSIQFVPWDQVHAIENTKPYKPFRGILCEWFNVCPQAAVKTNLNR